MSRLLGEDLDKAIVSTGLFMKHHKEKFKACVPSKDKGYYSCRHFKYEHKKAEGARISSTSGKTITEEATGCAMTTRKGS